jgi:hypothetical protein
MCTKQHGSVPSKDIDARSYAWGFQHTVFDSSSSSLCTKKQDVMSSLDGSTSASSKPRHNSCLRVHHFHAQGGSEAYGRSEVSPES